MAKRSEETKRKIAEAQTGKQHTAETKAKISAKMQNNMNSVKKDNVSVMLPISLINSVKELAELQDKKYQAIIIEAIIRGLNED